MVWQFFKNVGHLDNDIKGRLLVVSHYKIIITDFSSSNFVTCVESGKLTVWNPDNEEQVQQYTTFIICNIHVITPLGL